jgi:hypothetical protein
MIRCQGWGNRLDEHWASVRRRAADHATTPGGMTHAENESAGYFDRTP